jgi:hypothetical protein
MHSEAGFGKSRQLAALNALSVGYPPPLFSTKKTAAFGVEVRQGPAFRARGAGRLAQHRAEWSCPMCRRNRRRCRWADWLVNTSVAALLGLIGWGVYELLLR